MQPLGPWSQYEHLKKPERREATELVDLAAFHSQRHGNAGLSVELAYAQNRKLFKYGRIVAVDGVEYAAADDTLKVNKFDAFGPAYRPEATVLWLDARLAEIVSDAGIHLAAQGKTLIAFDGLRTVEATFLMAASNPQAFATGLLARPGKSAHNKGQAFDCVIGEADGTLLDMRDEFDHADLASPTPLATVHRNYGTHAGDAITPAQYENRLLLERAFMRAALANDRLIAPLREEFWDFRFPEERLDLWRIMESAARCTGDRPLLKQVAAVVDDVNTLLRTGKRAEALEKYEFNNYESFKAKWAEVFAGKEALLMQHLGRATPPPTEEKILYHGLYNPLYDRDLPAHQRLVNEPVFRRVCAEQEKKRA